MFTSTIMNTGRVIVKWLIVVLLKGENAIVAHAGAENAIKEEIGDRGFVITVFKKVE